MKGMYLSIALAAIVLWGCGGNTTVRPINSEWENQTNQTQNQNPVPPTTGESEDPFAKYPTEMREEARQNHPILLMWDEKSAADLRRQGRENESAEDQNDVLFSTVSEILLKNFRVYNAYQEIVNMHQELAASGSSATAIPEDFLFAKFSKASVCAYLWADFKPHTETSPEIGTVTFFFPEVRCRIVSTVTGEILASFNEVPTQQQIKQLKYRGSEAQQRYSAMQVAAKALAVKLKKRVVDILPNMIDRTVLIKGVLTAPKQTEQIRLVLKEMEGQRAIRIKEVITESAAGFRYRVLCKNDLSTTAQYLQEIASSSQGLDVKTRLGNRLIDVVLGDVEADEDLSGF